MHKLLERQLKRTIGSIDSIPKEWKDFIKIVDEVYRQADTDRTLLERSLDLTSEELFEKNQQLQQQVIVEQKRAADLERTQEVLAKRASELEAVAQVSTATLTVLDTKELLKTAVDLTKDSFDLYHAHIYLFDEISNSLVLAAGAGEVGQQMVAEDWSIPLEREQSLVARAARTRQGVIVNNVREAPDWLPNPLLPETHSELAVPLIAGDRVFGVLDVQSDEVDHFTGDDIRIQTTLAAQVAVALENVRHFEQAEKAELLMRERVKELDCLNDIGREMEENPPPLPELLEWITRRIPPAMQFPELALAAIEFEGQVYGDPKAIELPTQIVHGLYIGGEILGRIYIAYAEKRDFIDEESALLGGIATRVSGFIENRRLFEQTLNALTQVEQSQHFLRTLIDNIPNPVFYKDVNGAYLGFNRAFLEYLGQTEEELIGKTVYDLNTDKELADRYHEADMAVFRNQGVQVYESTVKHADGALRDVIFNKAAFTNPDGSLGGLVGVMVDITERKRIEETLRENEVRLSDATNIAQLGYWELDFQTQIFTFTDQLYALLRTTAAQEGGYQMPAMQYAQKFVHPDDAHLVGDEIQKAIETTDPNYSSQVEHRIIRADGSEGFILVRFRIIKDAQGCTIKSIGANQDITQRKQAEQERERLLAEVQRLAAIVENHPDFIAVGTLEGKPLYLNPAGLRMMGLPADHDVTAMDALDFFAIEDAERLVKEGIPTALEKGFWSTEANLLKVDGTTIPVNETIGVNYDATGTPYSLSITMRDIAEQKMAAEALRVSEERFALAMQGTNDGLWDWDIANNTVYWSPHLKEMHGYADDELDVDLDTLNLLLHPDDKEQMKAAMKAHLKDRVPLSVENRTRTKSGEYRWHYMRGQAVWDETGRALRLVGSVTDITERKQAEEALAKRATELETVAQVSTVALNVLDTTELLQTVVDLTKESFGLYHAHIYLLDEITDTLVLVAGAAEVGPQMVVEGWKIPFEQEQSLVARAARARQGVIVNDVSKVPDWLPNPLLPDTRSEMAVPLLVGERVLGVLDVQSDEVDRFTGDDIRIQTTLAAQVAVALENARLFEEGQRSSFLLNERVKELDCLNDIGREMEESPPPLPELLQWVTERIPSAMQYPDLSVVAIEFDGQVYGVPEAIELPNQITHGLYISGELMGRIYIAHTEKHDFIDEESALLGGVATRISGFIENQRLLEQSQQRSVELEKVLGEVRQLATIVENHPDFIGVGTLDGKVLYVNPAGLRMMGLPPDHIIASMEASDFHPVADAERLLKEGIPTAIEKGFWSTDETDLLKVDGTTVPVEETVSINYDVEGVPSSFSVTMHDVTNRKVAVAEQARLLAEVEASYRQYVRQEWEQYLREQHQERWHIEHQQTDVKIEPATDWLAKVQDEVLSEGKTKAIKVTGHNGDTDLQPGDRAGTAAIVAPISLRGQVIGTLNLQDIAPDRNWTAEEIALVEAVSEQLALTVETLRLFDDTRRHASREQLTRQITEKMRAAPDVDTIIETGLTELARVLEVSRTYVKLKPSSEPDR